MSPDYQDQSIAHCWISENETPTLQNAKERFASINKNGSTPFAFRFKDVFLPTV
ncbi:MAG: DUF3291 domain-containing protein [Emticicia sp.]